LYDAANHPDKDINLFFAATGRFYKGDADERRKRGKKPWGLFSRKDPLSFKGDREKELLTGEIQVDNILPMKTRLVQAG
jgi:hypothetical protein